MSNKKRISKFQKNKLRSYFLRKYSVKASRKHVSGFDFGVVSPAEIGNIDQLISILNDKPNLIKDLEKIRLESGNNYKKVAQSLSFDLRIKNSSSEI